MGTYTTKKEINRVEPILYDIGIVDTFEIEPKLKGLVFNNISGDISGVPSVSTNSVNQKVKITVTTTDEKVYTADFIYDVKGNNYFTCRFW